MNTVPIDLDTKLIYDRIHSTRLEDAYTHRVNVNIYDATMIINLIGDDGEEFRNLWNKNLNQQEIVTAEEFEGTISPFDLEINHAPGYYLLNSVKNAREVFFNNMSEKDAIDLMTIVTFYLKRDTTILVVVQSVGEYFTNIYEVPQELIEQYYSKKDVMFKILDFGDD